MPNETYYAGGETNPWTDAQSQNQQRPPNGGQQHGGQNPPSQPQQQYDGYAAPSGPPPGQARTQGRAAPDFDETAFVPADERAQQREALQQYEMNKSAPETQQARELEELQRQYPTIDGSLVAAIYIDAGNMGATRETLDELAEQTAGAK